MSNLKDSQNLTCCQALKYRVMFLTVHFHSFTEVDVYSTVSLKHKRSCDGTPKVACSEISVCFAMQMQEIFFYVCIYRVPIIHTHIYIMQTVIFT